MYQVRASLKSFCLLLFPLLLCRLLLWRPRLPGAGGDRPNWQLRARRQPLGYVWRQLLLRLSTHIDSNVTTAEGDDSLVLTGDGIIEGFAGRWRHEVVLLSKYVKERHVYPLQVHTPPPYSEFVLYQQVLLVEVVYELPDGLSSLTGTVKYPLLHAHKVLHGFFLVEIIQQAHVLVQHELEGLEHEKTSIEEIPRYDSESIYHVIDVQGSGPDMKQPIVRAEVYGGDHDDEIPYLLGVEGCVDDGEGPPLADAQQVNLVQPASLPPCIYSSVEVSSDIVFQGKVAVTRTRIAPIYHIYVLPVFQEAPDKAPVLLQVHHIRPVHQGVGDEKGNRRGLVHQGPVVEKPHPVLLVHQIPGRGTRIQIGNVHQHFHAFSFPAALPVRLSFSCRSLTCLAFFLTSFFSRYRLL